MSPYSQFFRLLILVTSLASLQNVSAAIKEVESGQWSCIFKKGRVTVAAGNFHLKGDGKFEGHGYEYAHIRLLNFKGTIADGEVELIESFSGFKKTKKGKLTFSGRAGFIAKLSDGRKMIAYPVEQNEVTGFYAGLDSALQLVTMNINATGHASYVVYEGGRPHVLLGRANGNLVTVRNADSSITLQGRIQKGKFRGIGSFFGHTFAARLVFWKGT